MSITYATLVDVNNKRKGILTSPLEPQYDRDDPGLDQLALGSISFSEYAAFTEH